jgi:hypothetical protein
MPRFLSGYTKEAARWRNLRALCEDPPFGTGGSIRVCVECGGELETAYRFCPWCAAPQRRKLVEFFSAHPRDAGKALRVSRYLTEDPHVRFSVWSPDGVAEAAVSLEEEEAERLAGFLAAPQVRRPSPVERVLSYLVRS